MRIVTHHWKTRLTPERLTNEHRELVLAGAGALRRPFVVQPCGLAILR
ncbi:MAG: hypothetical protein QOD52_2147 [Gaiellaceae bacterium]|nr:hypothetical protein [Gaiellaceae bacterium]